jgi:hypothetical protein
LDAIVQLNFGGMKNGVLPLRFEVLLTWPNFEHGKAVHVQPVQTSDCQEFGTRFGQRDVQNPFAVLESLGYKLDGERGFTCSRFAFDQVDVPHGQATAENIIETRTTGAASSDVWH